MSKYAVLVIDMLNDFVTGVLKTDRAGTIIGSLDKLVKSARKHEIPVIYCNDSHLKGLDAELKIWGDHALRGTHGAEVIPELSVHPQDYVVPKRRYSSFFQTELQALLLDLKVDTLIITGLHTNMCCTHTSADGFSYGYKIIVPKETTTAFTEEEYQSGLSYIKRIYDAEIIELDRLIARFEKEKAATLEEEAV